MYIVFFKHYLQKGETDVDLNSNKCCIIKICRWVIDLQAMCVFFEVVFCYDSIHWTQYWSVSPALWCFCRPCKIVELSFRYSLDWTVITLYHQSSSHVDDSANQRRKGQNATKADDALVRFTEPSNSETIAKTISRINFKCKKRRRKGIRRDQLLSSGRT